MCRFFVPTVGGKYWVVLIENYFGREDEIFFGNMYVSEIFF